MVDGRRVACGVRRRTYRELSRSSREVEREGGRPRTDRRGLLAVRWLFHAHNVRFKRAKDVEGYVSHLDSVASDVYVVGSNPMKQGPERVYVVSCKAWQTGFDAAAILAQLRGQAKNPKRPRELQFRELLPSPR
jgi:hypothetical protein